MEHTASTHLQQHMLNSGMTLSGPLRKHNQEKFLEDKSDMLLCKNHYG